jgi:hypothetical protein
MIMKEESMKYTKIDKPKDHAFEYVVALILIAVLLLIV